MAAIIAPNPSVNGFYDLSQICDISPERCCRITSDSEDVSLTEIFKILGLRWNLLCNWDPKVAKVQSTHDDLIILFQS